MPSTLIPLFLLLGALAVLFPTQSLLVATALVAWTTWQRQR